jgi:hypothetical protein
VKNRLNMWVVLLKAFCQKLCFVQLCDKMKDVLEMWCCHILVEHRKHFFLLFSGSILEV